jgi:hypothetical protein
VLKVKIRGALLRMVPSTCVQSFVTILLFYHGRLCSILNFLPLYISVSEGIQYRNWLGNGFDA